MQQLGDVGALELYFAAVLVIVTGMIAFSYVLGERSRTRRSNHARGEPYESGVVSVGTARLRLSAKFYLVALFFVIFDVEAVFVFAWAVSLRQAGWHGYVEMLIFLGVLLAALGYLWGIGALDWSQHRRADERG